MTAGLSPFSESSRMSESITRGTVASPRKRVSRFSTVLISSRLIRTTRSTFVVGMTKGCSATVTRTPLNVVSVRGRVIRKVVPEWRRVSINTCPPSFSTFSRTIASPSPGRKCP